jgi:hypothetical protein
MAQGNMGMWDKIVGNSRHYETDMRSQWREPVVTDADLIAGQRDVPLGRLSGIPKRAATVAFRAEPAWKRARGS